jgi:hypothetical protein
MKSKVLCQADDYREDERADKRKRQCAVVDLAFAFIFRTQEEDEEKDGGESRHKSKSEQRLVVRKWGVRRNAEHNGGQKSRRNRKATARCGDEGRLESRKDIADSGQLMYSIRSIVSATTFSLSDTTLLT